MQHKVCVVSGANSGVGFEAAKGLAGLGAHVVLVCRNDARGQETRVRIRDEVGTADLRVAHADFARLAQVRQLGTVLSGDYPEIHLLVNNAGTFFMRRKLTADGFERTFAVNHLSHFLLTQLVLHSLLAAAGRVINVSSEAHRRASLYRAALEEIIRGGGPYSSWRAYSDSKLANILFTQELARRYQPDQLCSVAMHPGVLATRIWNRNLNPASLLMRAFKPFMGKAAIGGDAIVYLAGEPREAVHGLYYEKRKLSQPAKAAHDKELAAELWRVSSELVGE
jgi:NAD(P)-dependent dehydrogenase (short-subunit alcohol dehydrogenase family)